MTKEETLKIMSMLSAYYGQPKVPAGQMANAWHIVLQHYDYRIAEKAVVEFAINDCRDYAVFPTIGKFREAIERTKRMPYRIIGKIRQGINYSDLDIIEKTAISETAYKKAQEMDDVTLVENVEKIAGYVSEHMLIEQKS